MENKGVSILFAVLILSVILSIGLGISVISIQQTKMLAEIGHSVIAFYAADSGIEEILLTETPASVSKTLPNGAKYEVFVKTPDKKDCDAQNYCIKSIGSYKKTKRALEIKY